MAGKDNQLGYLERNFILDSWKGNPEGVVGSVV